MKILIIPDVHGRDFWESPCSHIDEFDKVVFLGDYHDPYPFQVSQETSRHRLRDKLVPFVEANKDKVICLFGNHDGNYLVGEVADRFDSHHEAEIRGYLKRMNLQLIYEVDGYLFSHSGVLPEWLFANKLTFETLKTLKFTDPSLLQISPYRSGFEKVGSCIWGDVREFYNKYQHKEPYQIFGHTQLMSELITDNFACLDCRKAFILDTAEKTIVPWEEEN